MKRTRNGILIPDVPIMAGGTLPNAVKGVSAGGKDWKKHAVDMGLPSGTLWADCDIDVNMPDGFCVTPYIHEKSFFSWGNVDGHNPVAESFVNVYNWGAKNSNAPWYQGQVYGDTNGYTLNTDIPAVKEYDAAVFNLGEPWRMPSSDAVIELLDNIIYIDANGTEIAQSQADKRVEVNGILGVYLQSKINGKRLFFAASGNASGENWNLRNEVGFYWTNTVDGSTSQEKSFCFYSYTQIHERDASSRHLGMPIRAIIKF